MILTKEEKLQKIIDYVEKNDVSAYEIAKNTKLTEAGIGKILNKKSKQPREITVDEIYKYLFFTKQETQLKEKKPEYIPEGRVIEEDDYFKKTTYIIPVAGRGGLENEMYDPITFNDLKTEETIVKQQSHKNSTYFKIEVFGISMDDGSKFSLAEGDWAYCRSIPKKYWKTKFHTNKYEIFCFFHNQRGIIFKKIKSQKVDEGILTLTSLHPDKEQFPDFDISIYECSYICNVIRVVTDF